MWRLSGMNPFFSIIAPFKSHYILLRDAEGNYTFLWRVKALPLRRIVNSNRYASGRYKIMLFGSVPFLSQLVI